MSESRRERREAERGSKRRRISLGRPEAAEQESARPKPAEQAAAAQASEDRASEASVPAPAVTAAEEPAVVAPAAGDAADQAPSSKEESGKPESGKGEPAKPESGKGEHAKESASANKAAPKAAARASTPDSRAAAREAKPAGGRPKKEHTPGRKALGVVGSVAVLCLGAAAIAAGSLFPPELPAQGATTELTTLPAGDSLATCPASVRLLKGAGNGTDPEFAPASKDAKSLVRAAALSDSAGRIPGAQLLEANGSAGQQLAPRLAEAEAATLTGAAKDGTSQRKGVVSGGVSHDAPLSLRAQPLGGVQSLSAAARYYTAKDGDLAGLAAAPCTVPGSEAWITGAATTGGTTSILHLVNSSTSVSQVRIDLRGAGGMIPAPNLESVAIAPGESKSLVLAAYAPNEKSLSLKVVASGGRVNASIQQSTLRGLVPGGVDYLVAGTPAANSQVIPGVVLLDPKRAGELAGSAATADAVPELHVAATSAEGATVKIRIMGAAGEVAVPGGGELVVASNATARLPLTGLPAGAYTVVVQGDSAVSAAVKLVRGTKSAEPMDQAWAPGAARIGSEHLVVMPESGNAKLVLNAPAESSTVTLRPLGRNGALGAERKIELSGSKTVVLAVRDLGADVAAVMLSANGAPSYAATVVEEGAAGIAVLPLGEAPVGREGVQVQLRH
ncbi:DUF5719 family protein [Paeniglutamicibacter sp. NPDC091659]|uniref:DUF5719 family protein n=1 Tax=Paeniglutamicibacter sp. NPDC091659 TaxID=3364389 RepID=UPI00381BE48C